MPSGAYIVSAHNVYDIVPVVCIGAHGACVAR